MIPVSIHDRSHLTTEIDSRTAFLRTIERAQRAERLGYHRFWTAEHHGVPGVAGSAPAVLIAAIAHATTRIRVGAGGVMLPNHQPLVVAEQFATLEALFPDRIDLGLGRSLGFVRPVREALRRETYSVEEMADDIAELIGFLQGDSPVSLMPATDPFPVFMLATGKGAEVAGRAGLPLVIGGPGIEKPGDDGLTAVDRYRAVFQPSRFALDPYVVLNVTAVAADSSSVAAELALSEAWAHVNSKIAGAFLPLESPAAVTQKNLTDRQLDRMSGIASGIMAGPGMEVVELILAIATRIDADEVMLSSSVFDHSASLHSDKLLAEAFGLQESTTQSRDPIA